MILIPISNMNPVNICLSKSLTRAKLNVETIKWIVIPYINDMLENTKQLLRQFGLDMAR